MMGPGSGIKSVSDTGWVENLPYMKINTSNAKFSNPPGSGVNLTPEPGRLSCEYHVRNPPASEGLRLGSAWAKVKAG